MKDRLKKIRQERRMTQADFGKETGKNRDIISNYESGRVSPDDSFLQLLELKYGYRAEWIKTGKGDPKVPETIGGPIGRLAIRAARLDPEEVRRRIKAAIDGMEPERVVLMWELLKTSRHIQLDEEKDEE